MAGRSRQDIRRAIHLRIRKKVSGSTACPRLAIFRSANHIYAQIIDDVQGQTICAASSVEKAAAVKNGGNIDAAKTIGRIIAERAKEKGVTKVVFDRGGFIYHGRIKTLAEAAREAGLNF